MASAPEHPRPKRPTVGLDVPCKKCGRPIYYNYKGPVEGVCGRCADGAKKAARFSRSRRIGFFEGRRRGGRAIFAVVAVVVAAVVAYLIYSRL